MASDPAMSRSALRAHHRQKECALGACCSARPLPDPMSCTRLMRSVDVWRKFVPPSWRQRRNACKTPGKSGPPSMPAAMAGAPGQSQALSPGTGCTCRLPCRHASSRRAACPPLPSCTKRNACMLTPPPTLTPMERQLLHRVQELQHGLMTHLAEQDRKIAALEAEIRARDPSLDRLTDTL